MTPKRKPASNPVETEAKIRVASFVGVKRRIVAARGRLLTPRTLEVNTLFDSSAGRLRAGGGSLRVRKYGNKGLVTLKGAARVEGGLKSRIELETQVSDPEAMAHILLGLAYVPQFRYEKFREIWKVGRTVICLDATPIGHFVEIEGLAEDIYRVAAAIGLGASPFVASSYPALWGESGGRGDMVFRRRPAGVSSRPNRRKAGARTPVSTRARPRR